MGCFCKIGCLLCTAVLAAAGVCAWRFGPWYDDGTQTANDAPDFKALNVCDNCCNGLASNCDLPVNEVTFAMVHNAMSSKNDLFAGYNNLRPLEEALVQGYRGLMLDSCICDGSLGEKVQNFLKGEETGENYLGFCHVSCDAGVRSPAKVLGNIKTFLETNKNEVLILEFEISDNSLEELFFAIDESGLDEYVYRPPASTTVEWPTMQSLIDANTRLLLFAHKDGMESCTTMECPEGISYMYDHFQETSWDDGNGDETCDVLGTGREEGGFFLMNHWKNNDSDLPSKSNAEEFNTYDMLMGRFAQCEDRVPNVIAVDFWTLGDVLPFVDEVNKRNAGTAISETRTSAGNGRT